MTAIAFAILVGVATFFMLDSRQWRSKAQDTLDDLIALQREQTLLLKLLKVYDAAFEITTQPSGVKKMRYIDPDGKTKEMTF